MVTMVIIVCVGLCPCLWGSTVTILIIGRVSWNQLCVRVRHGLHSRCRHDQRSVQYSLALQHVRATHSSLFRKWKRALSESALSQYKPDLLHNATREEISGKKPLLLVITASQLCVAL